MALKKVWTDNNNISVSEGELYRLSFDIRIDEGQIMDFVQRIYPSATGLSFNDFELVEPATSTSPKGTVFNVKSNLRPTVSGSINADVALETNQLEDNVIFTIDNYSVEGPKCLNKYPINNYNFLRWRQGQNLFLPLSSDFDICGANELNEIPNAYADYFDRNKCKKYRPIITIGEQTMFCINAKIASETAELENLSIAILNEQGATIADDLGSVSLTTPDPNSEVLVYGNYTPSISEGLKNGRAYKFAIYNTVNNAIVFVSNEVVFADRDYQYRSVYLTYRNSSNRDGFAYQELPVDFYNRVRVELTRIERQPEIELTQYQSESTGRMRNQKTQGRKVLTLQAYFFDDYAHDAMLSLSMHDDIIINNRIMEVKTAYQIETNVRSNIDHGIIELYDQAYSTVNLAGNVISNPAPPTPPGPEPCDCPPTSSFDSVSGVKNSGLGNINFNVVLTGVFEFCGSYSITVNGIESPYTFSPIGGGTSTLIVIQYTGDIDAAEFNILLGGEGDCDLIETSILQSELGGI